MLFEKVPFLYGSGIIPTQFESFKKGIENLMMQQFFTTETLEKYLENESIGGDRLWEIVGPKIDYDVIFEALAKGVQESSLGGMLSMFGGSEAINSFKPSITPKLAEKFEEIVKGMTINITEHSEDYIGTVKERVHSVIIARLNELTPQMVKNIIQEMIRTHLGWLVVWGGVFGALIGVFAELLKIV